jgi:hypothetical protein
VGEQAGKPPGICGVNHVPVPPPLRQKPGANQLLKMKRPRRRRDPKASRNHACRQAAGTIGDKQAHQFKSDLLPQRIQRNDCGLSLHRELTDVPKILPRPIGRPS